MNVQYKEKFLFNYLNKNVEELQAQGNKISSLGFDLIYEAMEAYKRFSLIKRGADPIDGSHIAIDMDDSQIQYIMDHPYATEYPFVKELIAQHVNSTNPDGIQKQITAPQKAKGTNK